MSIDTQVVGFSIINAMGMIMCSAAFIVLANYPMMFRFTETLTLEAGLALALVLSMFILKYLLKFLVQRQSGPVRNGKNTEEPKRDDTMSLYIDGE